MAEAATDSRGGPASITNTFTFDFSARRAATTQAAVPPLLLHYQINFPKVEGALTHKWCSHNCSSPWSCYTTPQEGKWPKFLGFSFRSPDGGSEENSENLDGGCNSIACSWDCGVVLRRFFAPGNAWFLLLSAGSDHTEGWAPRYPPAFSISWRIEFTVGLAAFPAKCSSSSHEYDLFCYFDVCGNFSMRSKSKDLEPSFSREMYLYQPDFCDYWCHQCRWWLYHTHYPANMDLEATASLETKAWGLYDLRHCIFDSSVSLHTWVYIADSIKCLLDECHAPSGEH